MENLQGEPRVGEESSGETKGWRTFNENQGLENLQGEPWIGGEPLGVTKGWRTFRGNQGLENLQGEPIIGEPSGEPRVGEHSGLTLNMEGGEGVFYVLIKIC